MLHKTVVHLNNAAANASVTTSTMDVHFADIVCHVQQYYESRSVAAFVIVDKKCLHASPEPNSSIHYDADTSSIVSERRESNRCGDFACEH